jgi:type I restriction enzyme, S subunit
MSSFEGYQEVDSYWYDLVPSYWGKTKNKYVFCQNKHVVGENWEKFTLLTMGKSGVKPRDMDGGGKFPASFETYQTVEPNQLIFCLFDLDETPRTIGMSEDYGMITSAYDVFSTTEGNDPQFWTYFYQMIDDHKGLRPFYTGLRKVVRSDTFMGIEVFSPPVEEQQLISRYLDKKTEQIDSLIEKIQKKIELLKEQRTSLINQCVTKGLDPNVEMKNSGIEWIGEIPKHWKIIKTNLVSENLDGKRIPLNAVERDIRKGDIPYWGSNSIVGFVNDYIFDEELVLVGEDGSPFFDRDKPVSFVTTGKVWINNHIHVLRPKGNVTSEWLSESFNTVDYKEFITGSTRDKLTQSDLNRIPHVVPPIDEQRLICSTLLKRKESINKIIKLETTRIERLREYRQSLISSVVTGKVRVTEDMI